MTRPGHPDTADLTERIRAKRWGWQRAFEAWYLVHGESVSFVVDRDGRHLERPPGEFIKTNLDNLPVLGLDGIVQEDGTLQLDTAGQHRYQPLGELGSGFTAYERITS